MKGYKAFYFDLSCRPFAAHPMKYEVGGTYEFPDAPILCEKGFHFCEELPYVYVWYCQAFDIRVCEVEATGLILKETDPPKCVTNHIKIVRELEPKEILGAVHMGDVPALLNFEYNLTVSIQCFYDLPDRYILWDNGYNSTNTRTPSKHELPELRARADEWWRLLNGTLGENTPAKA